MKALSNSSNDTALDEDTESILDDKEGIQNENELDEKHSERKEESGVKRKFPPSFLDSILNKSSEECSQPKMKCWDTYLPEKRDKDDASTSSNLDESDIQPSELLKDKKEDHSLIKIPPTKRRKYSQRACAHCRQKYGIRNDTRYICTLCSVALCQEPCFSDHHCNK